jgi:hypothetical protein
MKSLPVLVFLLTVLIHHSALAQRMEPISIGGSGAQSAEAPSIVVLGLDRDMNTKVGPPAVSPLMNPTATIDVTYIGFSGSAQAAFQYAVDIWETLITSSVTIKVKANWTPLSPGVLGSASAASVWRDFGGGAIPGTWYPQALAEALTGGSLNHPDSSDINANFNSTFPNWYFGTDGNPPSGQYDFVTVVLHELGHGLGFFGSMSVTSGTGSWGAGSGFPFIYDRFAENGSNQQLINTTIFPNPSVALGTQLTSNNIFFDGPNATPANGGTPPKLYCPGTWTSGSSFSHLDETTYPAGNPHSLMTPMVGTAEAIHSPGTVTLALFEDWGWSTTPPPPSNIKWEERFTSMTIPPGWRVVDNDGSGGALAYVQQITFTSGDTVRPQIGASFWFSNFTNANGSGMIDEWLIGPRVTNIEDGDSLYFYAGAIGGAFDDSLRVFISTTDSAFGSFTNQIGYLRVDGPVGSWHAYGFDLSSFAGEDIFVAVNYYIVDGGPTGTHSDNLWIDHFLITTEGVTSVADDIPATPRTFLLHQNYPNPFNPTTEIGYELATQSRVRIDVTNALGQQVRVLEDGEKSAGIHRVSFDAKGLSAGVYFYRMTAQGSVQTRKMMLIR